MACQAPVWRFGKLLRQWCRLLRYQGNFKSTDFKVGTGEVFLQ
jgi:hypothetical protein